MGAKFGPSFGLTTCGRPWLKLLSILMFYDVGLRPISGAGRRKLQPNLAPTPNILKGWTVKWTSSCIFFQAGSSCAAHSDQSFHCIITVRNGHQFCHQCVCHLWRQGLFPGGLLVVTGCKSLLCTSSIFAYAVHLFLHTLFCNSLSVMWDRDKIPKF